MRKIGFNSILVRLKLSADITGIALFFMFQFHIGAIKICERLQTLPDDYSFNSILVRLK